MPNDTYPRLPTPDDINPNSLALSKRIVQQANQVMDGYQDRDVWDAVLISLINSEVRPLVAALEGVKTGSCWCGVGIGNPMYRKHSSHCEAARAALKQAKGDHHADSE